MHISSETPEAVEFIKPIFYFLTKKWHHQYPSDSQQRCIDLSQCFTQLSIRFQNILNYKNKAIYDFLAQFYSSILFLSFISLDSL